MFMKTEFATDVRKNWSQFLDTVIREKPQAVQRNRDLAIFIEFSQMQVILTNYRFTLEYELEKDGHYTGSLQEIDLIATAKTLEDLKDSLANQLLDYADEYMQNFNLYFHSPNRRDHFPYVMHVLIKESVLDVVQLIDA